MRPGCAVIALVLGCTGTGDIPAPTISSVMPDHGAAGSAITLAGDYFCQQRPDEDPLACANVGTLEFGVVPGTVSTYADQMITADVPLLEPGTVRISIDVAGRHSNSVGFRVDP